MLLLLLACRDAKPPQPAQSPDSEPQPPRCEVLPKPGDPSALVRLTPVYEGLELSSPTAAVWIEGGQGDGRWVVAERYGAIWTFGDEEPADPLLIADLAPLLGDAKHGLLGLARHPEQPLWFLSFTQRLGDSEARSLVIKVPERVDGRLDLDQAEQVLSLPQPSESAVGGRVAFDAQGRLILAFGEGGVDEALQRSPGSWYGKFLRLDVEGAEATPEVFASGFRNPWGWWLDPVTEQLWVADPGTELWEEIDLLVPGGDHGWPIYEGPDCLREDERCEEDFVEPVYAYAHDEGPRAVIGGPVYRGSALPEWDGALLFADYLDQGLYALTLQGDEVQVSTLLSAGPRFATLTTGPGGELYGFEFEPTGSAWRMEPLDGPAPGFPSKLSETGCFQDLATMKPSPGVVPYSVNAPLWADGAHQQRYIVLPAGAMAPGSSPPIALPAGSTDDPAGDYASWELPIGTLVIDHLALGSAAIGAVGSVPVETRMMRRDANAWRFFTWVWQKDGKDASFVPGAVSTEFVVPKAGGGTVLQPWAVPGGAQCKSCHSGGPGGTRLLGMQTAQLNRDSDFDGKTFNQLDVLRAAKWLPADFGKPGGHAALPDQHDLVAPAAAALDGEARAWLHVQCASCHAPGASANTDFDLRASTPLAKTKTCNIAASVDFGVAAMKLVTPGEPAASALVKRVALPATDSLFMPQVGVTTAHAAGVALVEAWVSSLKGCN